MGYPRYRIDRVGPQHTRFLAAAATADTDVRFHQEYEARSLSNIRGMLLCIPSAGVEQPRGNALLSASLSLQMSFQHFIRHQQLDWKQATPSII